MNNILTSTLGSHTKQFVARGYFYIMEAKWGRILKIQAHSNSDMFVAILQTKMLVKDYG